MIRKKLLLIICVMMGSNIEGYVSEAGYNQWGKSFTQLRKDTVKSNIERNKKKLFEYAILLEGAYNYNTINNAPGLELGPLTEKYIAAVYKAALSYQFSPTKKEVLAESIEDQIAAFQAFSKMINRFLSAKEADQAASLFGTYPNVPPTEFDEYENLGNAILKQLQEKGADTYRQFKTGVEKAIERWRHTSKKQ